MKYPITPFSPPLVLVILVLLGCEKAPVQKNATTPGQEFPYSFNKSPFISPQIIQDFNTWLSDSGDAVVSINVLEAQASNRYSGAALVRNTLGEEPYVYSEQASDGSISEFGYRYVGRTSSGVYVLLTSDGGGGSGVFHSLMLLTFEYDQSLICDWDRGVVQPTGKRLLIKKQGQISLTDRWDGKLSVKGNSVFIGEDVGWFAHSEGTGGGSSSTQRKEQVLEVQLAQ